MRCRDLAVSTVATASNEHGQSRITRVRRKRKFPRCCIYLGFDGAETNDQKNSVRNKRVLHEKRWVGSEAVMHICVLVEL